MSKKSQQKHINQTFVRVGKVMVDPNNPLALAVARAGEKFEGVAFSHKPSDEREAVSAAEAKRARKAAKRIRDRE